MSYKGKRLELSLQTIISLVLITSVLLLSAILIGKSYLSHRALLLSASEETAFNLAENLDTQMLRLVNPLNSTLRLLSHDNNLTHSENLQERRQGLGMMVEALNANPILSAVYAGYEDGSFFLVRTLRDRRVRESLHAPENAVYLLQSVERDEDGNWQQAHWLYYDQDLALLETQVRDDYRYDPRTRPWFNSAASQSAVSHNDHETVLTDPYIFFTTRDLGITLALMDADTGTVLGIDASVSDLSVYLEDLKSRMTPHSQLAVANADGRVLAFPDLQRLIKDNGEGGFELASIHEISAPALQQVFTNNTRGEIREFQHEGETWFGVSAPMLNFMDEELKLLIALPASQLLASARSTVVMQVVWSVLIALVLLLIAMVISRKIFHPFQQLSEEVQSLASFDFSKDIKTRSHITELNNLCVILSQMASTIFHFQQISKTLAREKDLEKMLQQTLLHIKESTAAEGVAIYLYDEDAGELQRADHINLYTAPEVLACPQSSLSAQRKAVAKAVTAETIIHNRDKTPDEALHETPDNTPDKTAAEPELGAALLTTGLLDRDGNCTGVLVMQMAADAGDISGLTLTKNHKLRSSFNHFIDELSGSAATAIETRKQIEVQRSLIDAIIQLLADAIDAKSPYTMGHCERVPELAELLIDAVQATDQGELAEFSMTDTERYEFRIAAWMHDCGKITSPEYIVDKATKLETLYNRIHEIRTRFEVLWRDVEIRYLQGLLAGEDVEVLQQHKEQEQQQLQLEFAEIAHANIGGESMAEEAIERIRNIGQRQWLRHFDKHLGLSRDERERLATDVDEQLPVTEYLLADRDDHLIHWDEARKPPVEKGDPRNVWGFDMQLPAHSLNLGELYNLSIQRGTLTPEDRFKINDHIVQTICMLSRLPLPPYLKRVPDIAGNHHEKIDGTGYPRRLPGESLSIPEKVMAIADIFEALTAADRPYKEAKTLEESLRIMAFMARDAHIDMTLFRLFIEQEVYADYATRFMQPKQITPIDKAQILALAEGH